MVLCSQGNSGAFVRGDQVPGTRHRFAAPALIVAFICAGCAQPMGGSAKYFNSYLNQVPPELAEGAWINSAENLSLAALRGQVVWLEFSFLQ